MRTSAEWVEARANTGGNTRKAWQVSGWPTGKIRGPQTIKESVSAGGSKPKGCRRGRLQHGLLRQLRSCPRGSGALHYARPRRSRPPSRPPSCPPHRASERPPAAQVARSARLSRKPSSSPAEERRRPGLALSIFSSSCCSRTSRRCHLRTPRAGEGRGRGERKPEMRLALAR